MIKDRMRTTHLKELGFERAPLSAAVALGALGEIDGSAGWVIASPVVGVLRSGGVDAVVRGKLDGEPFAAKVGVEALEAFESGGGVSSRVKVNEGERLGGAGGAVAHEAHALRPGATRILLEKREEITLSPVLRHPSDAHTARLLGRSALTRAPHRLVPMVLWEHVEQRAHPFRLAPLRHLSHRWTVRRAKLLWKC